MIGMSVRRVVGLASCLLLGGIAASAAPRAMTDQQLDAIYAAGFEVQVDLSVDLAATHPESVLVQGGSAEAVQNFMNSGLTLSHTSGGTRNDPVFDPSGAVMPNLQNLTVNNINISENALSNATTLMNVFALEGDIAIGVNLNVVVNPVNSPFTVNQQNINWGMFNLSDTFSTLAP